MSCICREREAESGEYQYGSSRLRETRLNIICLQVEFAPVVRPTPSDANKFAHTAMLLRYASELEIYADTHCGNWKQSRWVALV